MKSSIVGSMQSEGLAKVRERQRRLEELKLAEEQMARRALKDPFFWLTECTATQDEQDNLNPFKPFPKKDYIRHTLTALEREAVLFLKKSRTMMMSWTVSAHCGYRMFTKPATGVVFVSQDEDRAVQCVQKVKCLYSRSIEPLRKRWPEGREKQPYNSMLMANHSWCIGIPGKDPDKIRAMHPTVVVMDEAAHMDVGLETFNVALATRCLQIVALSSANPGWFEDIVARSKPVDWPYTEEEKAA